MAIVRVPVERVRKGRPPLAEGDKPVRIHFVAPEAMAKAFEDLAAELKVSKSDVYRGAMADYLRRAKIDWEG